MRFLNAIVLFVQESPSWVGSGGCSSSRPCRSTSSCAVRTQQGASWISLASQSHTICTHTHTHTHTHVHVHHPHISRLEHSTHSQVWFTLSYSCTWVSRVVCSCVQIQRFLPHVLLPERPLHRTALWEHGPPSWDDPRQGGEQIGEGKTAGLIKKWLSFCWGRIHLPLSLCSRGFFFFFFFFFILWKDEHYS